ncbi:MAG: response regulator [candidate division Zixibacteria bacterium]|nr:response regulator [candidate division Zixibacteria bacterium]MBU1469799.1 response regulator [candidate division Zixibacteria bacterium]MBU2625375.1 response regulator [candidate division Zixibacteria bacterium]
MAKKILIVEDEQDQRTWLETFFADNDYETISAEDGQIGFEKAKSEKPDLITLDISMDNESGIKMFRNVQDTPETSAIPVIMITGVSPEFKKFIEKRKQVHPPAGYFEKPVDRDALLKKVKELIG